MGVVVVVMVILGELILLHAPQRPPNYVMVEGEEVQTDMDPVQRVVVLVMEEQD
jgi:cell division septal protein FtsQ